MYSQYKFGGSLKGNLIEPFLIVKAESTDEDRAGATARPAKESRYSFGFRAAGKNIAGLGGFDYTVEPVWQRGTTQAAGVSKLEIILMHLQFMRRQDIHSRMSLGLPG